jgi:hypothetical protein
VHDAPPYGRTRDSQGFAPIGQLLRPKLGQGRLELVDESQNGRSSACPRLSFATVRQMALDPPVLRDVYLERIARLGRT